MSKNKVKAIVRATNNQLEEVGCDRELSDTEVCVTDIDKWSGMYSPCSTVICKFKLSDNYEFEEEYIIPTRWLEFVEKM